MTVLLSIKPQFAQAIFDGEKKFEYRKTIFKKHVQTVQVYVTKPIGKIVGEFSIVEIIQDNPLSLWEKTYKYSGVKKDFYMKYFDGKETGYAPRVRKIVKYERPICPYSQYEHFTAPQSFRYLPVYLPTGN